VAKTAVMIAVQNVQTLAEMIVAAPADKLALLVAHPPAQQHAEILVAIAVLILVKELAV